MLNLSAPDLTQHAPRSPRVRLGGYVHLPRLLDKARAVIAGKNAGYNYNCPLDKHFFGFTGIDQEALLATIKTAKSDTEILAWVRENTRRLPSEIAAWSTWLSAHGAGGVDGHAWFSDAIKNAGPDRDDIQTFFDLLDLDDYVSYGGKS